MQEKINIHTIKDKNNKNLQFLFDSEHKLMFKNYILGGQNFYNPNKNKVNHYYINVGSVFQGLELKTDNISFPGESYFFAEEILKVFLKKNNLNNFKPIAELIFLSRGFHKINLKHKENQQYLGPNIQRLYDRIHNDEHLLLLAKKSKKLIIELKSAIIQKGLGEIIAQNTHYSFDINQLTSIVNDIIDYIEKNAIDKNNFKIDVKEFTFIDLFNFEFEKNIKPLLNKNEHGIIFFDSNLTGFKKFLKNESSLDNLLYFDLTNSNLLNNNEQELRKRLKNKEYIFWDNKKIFFNLKPSSDINISDDVKISIQQLLEKIYLDSKINNDNSIKSNKKFKL